jgi:cellulose biosynthesis protein BcsQ
LIAVQVVAVLSLKGGVGKTTVALGLAGAAQQHGVPTLLVDLDPQANATIATDAAPATATVADVLDDPRRSVLRRAVAPSGWGEGLDVLVGAEQTERHNHPDPSAKQLVRLARALGRLGPADSDGPTARTRGRTRALPPRRRGLPAVARAAHPQRPRGGRPGRAGDRPDDVRRLRRAARLRRRADRAGARQPALQPLGVLINRVRPRNAEHEFRVAELRELFGPLVFPGVLPDRSAIQQAQGACVPIQRWDTPGAREASAVFTTLLGRVLRAERRPRTPAAPPSTR